MDPRDERQYRRMLGVIDDVRGHRRSLVAAADGLLALRDEVASLNNEEASTFTSLLLTLESAGTDNVRGVLPPGRSLNRMGELHPAGLSPLVLDALDQLEALVRSRLASPT